MTNQPQKDDHKQEPPDGLGFQRSQEPDRPKSEMEEQGRKAEEYLNSWKRAAADFENYKKRRVKEDQELVGYTKLHVLDRLLPVLEALEYGLRHAPRDEQNKLWSKGMDETLNKLVQVMREMGIEKIKTVGEEYNHELHEAVEMVESKDAPSGSVVEEVAAGYKVHGRVLKPAKVKVAR